MRVFSNTATSLDGKIASHSFVFKSLGTRADWRMMSVIRAQADAVLTGGRTFRVYPNPLIERAVHLESPRHRERRMINAVMTRRGVLDAAPQSRLPDPRIELLILGPTGLDAAAHRERFGAEVITTDEPTISWALDVLAARGVQSTLIEGGGDLIFQAVDAQRLDELYVTLCPWLIGGTGAPTLMDGPGFDIGCFRHLQLKTIHREGDELFLHYAIRTAQG